MKKIKETYLLQTTYTDTCPVCRGHKTITEKFYHNQLKECSCYHCRGTGKVERVETVDVTELINSIFTEAISTVQECFHTINELIRLYPDNPIINKKLVVDQKIVHYSPSACPFCGKPTMHGEKVCFEHAILSIPKPGKKES